MTLRLSLSGTPTAFPIVACRADIHRWMKTMALFSQG